MPSQRPILRARTRALVWVLAFALCASPFAAATSALAEDGDYMAEGATKKADDFARPGGYLSLVVGGASQMFKGDYEGISALDPSMAVILGLRGGRRINKLLAFDVSADWSVKGFEVSSGADTLEARSVTGFGNLKIYPFGGRIQPYAMGGVGFLWGVLNCSGGGFTSQCDEGIEFAGRAGGGLDVYLTPNIALGAEVAYVIPTGYFKDLDYLQYTGNLIFRF